METVVEVLPKSPRLDLVIEYLVGCCYDADISVVLLGAAHPAIEAVLQYAQ
jgi:hypothetical protein